MSFSVYHRPAPVPAPTRVHPGPAVAVCYARFGLTPVDALVLNGPANDLLTQVAEDAGDCGPVCEVELLFDPVTGEVGIAPWWVTRPDRTRHEVTGCSWPAPDGPAGPDHYWSAAMRVAWPRKIAAPMFLGTWDVRQTTIGRPAAARIHDGMIVFNPRQALR